MVIKASAAAEVTALVRALTGAGADPRADDVQREAAIARLSVIGGRAVDKLHRAYEGTTDLATRLAILRTLEAIPDHRNLPLAADALAGGGDVAIAAIGVLRALLPSERGRGRHGSARGARHDGGRPPATTGVSGSPRSTR